MKRLKIFWLFAVALVLLLCQVLPAQTADPNTARIVAQNWVNTIIDYYGSWAGADEAYIADVIEFKRGNRTLGYYCTVEPGGFVLVSL
ncbi:MAG: hypothetical protein PVH24_03860, partial [Candidatus Zixiibacteriota bacterium]